MYWTTLAQFYNSTEWYDFKTRLILERGMTCEECGGEIFSRYECIPHHTEELTTENVNDYLVSLNPTKIKLVHLSCHNRIHNKFGYKQRKVYLVWGAAAAGKSTLVKQSAAAGDLVLDMDALWDAVCHGGRKEKPPALNQTVFALRDCLLDEVRMRRGRWQVAWVTGTYPSRGERERIARMLGAEMIFVDTPRDVCLQRCGNDSKRKGYVEEFFAQYSPH